MGKKKKNMVKEPLSLSFGKYDLDKPIEEVIQMFVNWKNAYPDKVLSIEWVDNYWDEGGEHRLHESREETDAEYDTRMEQERTRKDAIRERELAELARLQARYKDA